MERRQKRLYEMYKKKKHATSFLSEPWTVEIAPNARLSELRLAGSSWDFPLHFVRGVHVLVGPIVCGEDDGLSQFPYQLNPLFGPSSLVCFRRLLKIRSPRYLRVYISLLFLTCHCIDQIPAACIVNPESNVIMKYGASLRAHSIPAWAHREGHYQSRKGALC